MIINSHHVEFGYELLSVIPYAYYQHTRNRLEKTISGRNTNDWYFFSPDHTEVDKLRSAENNKYLTVPNKNVHGKFDFSQWKSPDYSNYFKHEAKSLLGELSNIVIISNKYNKEWAQPPCNYIHLETLDQIFQYLTSKKYTIIYNRLTHNMNLNDVGDTVDLNFGDFNLIKEKHSNVLTMQKLMDRYNIDYNTLLLRLSSMCDKFISVQGGTSITSSMFGGTNIILFNKGGETQYTFDEVYPRLSGANINRVGTGAVSGNLSTLTELDLTQAQAVLFDTIQSKY